MTQIDTRHLSQRPASTTDERLSPVDQILAAPQGKALLDSAPAGKPVTKAMWLLPAFLGIVGGVIGWLIVRNSNRTAGRVMLVLGVVFTITTWAMSGMMSSLLSTSLSAFGM